VIASGLLFANLLQSASAEMRWWNQLRDRKATAPTQKPLPGVRLSMQGWNEEAPSGRLRVWRDGSGAVLTLAILLRPSTKLPDFSDEAALRRFARDAAKSVGAGLIEVRVMTGTPHPSVSWIYKQLRKPAYVFTGMLFIAYDDAYQGWTIMAGETGTTGVREAVVTSELINAGKLTVSEFERSWAQDPYDPSYHGVDPSVLRFMSDDASYDGRFPDHPLSRIRQVLTILPQSIQSDF
jgi:hypothetical protein